MFWSLDIAVAMIAPCETEYAQLQGNSAMSMDNCGSLTVDMDFPLHVICAQLPYLRCHAALACFEHLFFICQDFCLTQFPSRS